jgi:hypothetical protein
LPFFHVFRVFRGSFFGGGARGVSEILDSLAREVSRSVSSGA